MNGQLLSDLVEIDELILMKSVFFMFVLVCYLQNTTRLHKF